MYFEGELTKYDPEINCHSQLKLHEEEDEGAENVT